MSPSVAASWRRWHAAAGSAIALLLVAALVVIGGSDGVRSLGAVQNRDVGGGVMASGGALPSGLTAVIAEPAKTSVPSTSTGPAWVRPLTGAVELRPSGPLSAPITFAVPLRGPVGDDDVLLARVNHSHPFDPLAAESAPVELAPDRTHALVTLDHLSVLEVASVSRSAVGKLVDDFVEEAFSGAFSEAKGPSCKGTARAESDGYSFTAAASQDAVAWCHGYEKSDRIVRVVNTRRYPLEVIESSNLPVLDSGDVPVSMVEGYRLHHLVVMPREDMTFAVNPLDPGASATLATRASGWGTGLTAVDAVAKAFLLLAAGLLGKATEESLAALKGGRLTMLDDFGLKGVTLADFMRKILDAEACTVAMGGDNPNLTKVLGACFTADGLARAVAGVVGLVARIQIAVAVAAFVAVSSVVFAVIDFPRVLANYLGDKQNGRDTFRLTVARADGIALLAGEWWRHGTQLTLKADGSGTIVTAEGAQGCLGQVDPFSGAPPVMCTFHGVVQLKRSSGGDLEGVYTDSWLTENDGHGGPETRVAYTEYVEGPIPGLRFTVKSNAGRTIVAYEDLRGASYTLCGTRSSATEKADCGA